MVWANAASAVPDAALVVSSSKTADANVYDAQLVKSGGFGRTTDYLNVSGLSGNYYIRIHQMLTGDSATSCSVGSRRRPCVPLGA